MVSTMALVDSIEEQHVLERLLDDTKPAVPAAAAHLHWLLFTPFRYPPPPGGSRFRGPNDPGVFYGADAIRTACAELGYWRWRHLLDSPALNAMPTKPQTVFQVKIKIDADRPSREAVRAGSAALDRSPATIRAARTSAARRAQAGVGAIRYESVRDPKHDGCCAVLSPAAFAPPLPARAADVDAVGRPRSGDLAADARAGRRRARIRRSAMVALRALGRTEYEPTWRAMQAFTAARAAGTPDEIWLTEHPPVYTLGLAGRREHLLRDNGIPTVKVDRGGQITYHGPGQLVVYLLCDLRGAKARGPRDGPLDRGRGGRMA